MAQTRKIKQRYSYRTKKNLERMDKIISELNVTGTNANKLRSIIKGKDGLHTKATLNRVKKIQGQVKKGTFNIKRYIAKDNSYAGVRKFIRTTTNINEILNAADRDDFYYDNQELITAYNETQAESLRKEMENKWNLHRSRNTKLAKL